MIDNGIPIIKGLYGKLIEKSYKENIKGPLYTTRKNFSKELTKPDWKPLKETVFPKTVESLEYLKKSQIISSAEIEPMVLL